MNQNFLKPLKHKYSFALLNSRFMAVLANKNQETHNSIIQEKLAHIAKLESEVDNSLFDIFLIGSFMFIF